MKKLISVLAALCLLLTAAAALAETEEVTLDKMPAVVTLDEGVELKDADFEGEWIVDTVFLNEAYLTPEMVEELGLNIRPMRIADGKIYNVVTDDAGEHEVSEEYKLENNQILFTDGQGLEAVFEKLEDGNIVMSIFIPGENDTTNCATFFLVHPEQ